MNLQENKNIVTKLLKEIFDGKNPQLFEGIFHQNLELVVDDSKISRSKAILGLTKFLEDVEVEHEIKTIVAEGSDVVVFGKRNMKYIKEHNPITSSFEDSNPPPVEVKGKSSTHNCHFHFQIENNKIIKF